MKKNLNAALESDFGGNVEQDCPASKIARYAKMPANTQFEAHKNVIRLNITQFELTKLLYTEGILGELDLTPTAKLFLWALCSHFNPENDSMFPSQQTVAKKLGISEKSAQRAVRELKNAGLIDYETKRVNHYVFGKKFFELVKMSAAVGQNVSHKGGQNVPLTKNKEKRKNNENFSFKFYKRGQKTCRNEQMAAKMVPNADETKKMLDEQKKAKTNAFNPYECTENQAKQWLQEIPAFWLSRSKMAKFLVEKYNIIEFQHILKNNFENTPGALQNLINSENPRSTKVLADDSQSFLERYKIDEDRIYNEIVPEILDKDEDLDIVKANF